MEYVDIITQVLQMAVASPWGKYVLAIVAILGSLVSIASVIAPFTKTTIDDTIAAKGKAIMQRLSVLKPKPTEDKTL